MRERKTKTFPSRDESNSREADLWRKFRNLNGPFKKCLIFHSKCENKGKRESDLKNITRCSVVVWQSDQNGQFIAILATF